MNLNPFLQSLKTFFSGGLKRIIIDSNQFFKSNITLFEYVLHLCVAHRFSFYIQSVN